MQAAQTFDPNFALAKFVGHGLCRAAQFWKSLLLPEQTNGNRKRSARLPFNHFLKSKTPPPRETGSRP